MIQPNPLDPWWGLRQWYRNLWPAERLGLVATMTLTLVIMVWWVTQEPSEDRLKVKNWVRIASYYEANLEVDPEADLSKKDPRLTKNPKYQGYLQKNQGRVLHLRHKTRPKKQALGTGKNH